MGFRGKHKNKRDANEAAIFAVLRAHGLSVEPLDTPADALVGFGGRTYLVEVKSAKGQLTGPQFGFLETWKGDHHILRSENDAWRFAVSVRNGNVQSEVELRGKIS